MDEIDPIESVLREDNPRARPVDLRVYADALRTYCQSDANLRKNGAICAHPRTGAPMENPYLKIRTTQGALLARMKNIRGERALACAVSIGSE